MPRIAIKAEPTNTIIVNFLTNRFVSAAGSYYGLFAGSEFNPTSSGLIVLRSTAQMTYGACVYLDGDVIKNIKGAFDINGHSTVSVVRPNGKSSIVIDLQLGFDRTLTGTVSSALDGWSATIDADQAVFNSKAPAQNFAGKYTMLIPGFDSSSDGPVGYGFTVINVGQTGVITAVGNTADNHGLRPISVPVSANGRWPFYARQYVTATGCNGGVIGWVQFTNNAPTSTFTGNLHWFKKNWTNGYYNSGFSHNVTSIGSALTVPAKLTLNTATATFSGGDFTSATNDQLAIADGILIKTANPSPIGRAYTYNAGNGIVTALRTINAPAVTKGIRACYLQNQNLIGGYFLGTTQTGRLEIK